MEGFFVQHANHVTGETEAGAQRLAQAETGLNEAIELGTARLYVSERGAVICRLSGDDERWEIAAMYDGQTGNDRQQRVLVAELAVDAGF